MHWSQGACVSQCTSTLNEHMCVDVIRYGCDSVHTIHKLNSREGVENECIDKVMCTHVAMQGQNG